MQFYRKLAELRKAAGMSQEELAERADVSRQTVFKWEAGLTTPSMENILSLCRIFGVSADELIGNEPEADSSGGAEKKEEAKEGKSDDQIPAPVPFPRFRYEYKSRRTLFGLPLVHICLGTGRCRAKGILAVGNEAVGIVAVGIASLGVFSIGAVSAGLFAIAALSLAALSVGAIAVGVLAVGSVAVGVLAVGSLSVGVYSVGACAVAARIAATTSSGFARAPVVFCPDGVPGGGWEILASDFAALLSAAAERFSVPEWLLRLLSAV